MFSKVWFDDMTFDGTRDSIAASQAALGASLYGALVHFPGTVGSRFFLIFFLVVVLQWVLLFHSSELN